MITLTSKEIPVDDPIAAIELFMENGWTDGLPIVPPTPALVRRMVGDYDPQELLGYIPPKYGGATIEKLAINAVMAGCKPAYLPVIIAGVKAMLTEVFNLQGVQSTTHMSTPTFVVNGPIARTLNINSKAGCLGSGFRPNATMGRALRLMMMNLGGGIPGETDKATFGHPGKYAYLWAENEEESPWEPFHVERGFRSEESTITAFPCEPPHNINNHAERDPFQILYGIAGAMKGTGHNNFYVMGDTMVVLCPEHAASIAEHNWRKRDVKYYLWETARQPLRELKYNGMYGAEYEKNYWPRWVDRSDEETLAPIVRTPDDILVFVAGGKGRHSVFIPGWGTRAVTQKSTCKAPHPPLKPRPKGEGEAARRRATMSQASSPFIVLSPQPELFPRGGTLAPRLDTLRGKTIAFLDNNKLQPRNRYFDLLGELLQEREGVKDVIYAQKPFFTRPAREDVLKPLMARADAVVTGVGE